MTNSLLEKPRPKLSIKEEVLEEVTNSLYKEKPEDDEVREFLVNKTIDLTEKLTREDERKEIKKEIEEAKKEYNELRRFVGKDYPKGKCKNLLKLLEIDD